MPMWQGNLNRAKKIFIPGQFAHFSLTDSQPL
jgi:hypothetical protein